jgi:PAS domain-containing protein
MKQNLESEITRSERLDANDAFPINHWVIDADLQSYAGDILKAMREPLLVLDGGLRVKAATRAYYETFKVTPEQTLSSSFYELGNGQWNIPALRKLLDELVRTSSEFDGHQVEHDFPDIGRRTMLLNARRLRDGEKNAMLILLAIQDITGRRIGGSADRWPGCMWR